MPGYGKRARYCSRYRFEGEFMRDRFLIAVLVIIAAMTELFLSASAQDASAKANQARAFGGDTLKTLPVTGNDAAHSAKRRWRVTTTCWRTTVQRSLI